MRRRNALYTLLATFSVPVPQALALASELLEPAAESADAETAIGRLSGYVDQLGAEQMLPDSEPVTVQVGALAAWRDLHNTAGDLNGARAAAMRADALQTAARAAALVAEVHHDAGDVQHGRSWYLRALNDADRAAASADEGGHSRLRRQACATAALVRTLYAKKALATHPEHAEREALRACEIVWDNQVPRSTAHAFAPSVVARARALTGNHAGAATALHHAAEYLRVEDYPDTDRSRMSVLRYYPRSHAYAAADVLAHIGDVREARSHTEAYTSAPGPRPVMNGALLDLAEAQCRMREAGPDAAADHAVTVLSDLPARNRTMTVLGRADLLARRAEQNTPSGARPPASVRQLRELVSTGLAGVRPV